MCRAFASTRRLLCKGRLDGLSRFPSPDRRSYAAIYEELKVKYEAVISEYNGNRKNTVGLNDITIIALAKTLGLPVVSSEKKTNVEQDSEKRQKIPDVCEKEGIQHLSFNELLRAEAIKG